LGEGAFNYWFENAFGMRNYYLGRQRWGASIKAFRSLSEFQVGDFSSVLQTSTFDLKYRLTPGLWGRDETWGVMSGFQGMSYADFKADIVGGGIFWARSMPRVFDDMMNTAPFFRYPKWVDLEFIYYPVILTSESKPKNFGNGTGNWALNFHGKLMWTKRVFGEAGFGIRNFDFNKEIGVSPNLSRLNFKFTSIYGTVGLGINF
jgi:hypothetical protein